MYHRLSIFLGCSSSNSWSVLLERMGYFCFNGIYVTNERSKMQKKKIFVHVVFIVCVGGWVCVCAWCVSFLCVCLCACYIDKVLCCNLCLTLARRAHGQLTPVKAWKCYSHCLLFTLWWIWKMGQDYQSCMKAWQRLWSCNICLLVVFTECLTDCNPKCKVCAWGDQWWIKSYTQIHVCTHTHTHVSRQKAVMWFLSQLSSHWGRCPLSHLLLDKVMKIILHIMFFPCQ